nr:FRG domain-containing protein [Bradyrhizobium sp. 6(2017)]
MLLFRGQGADFRNIKRNSSLKPTLFRGGRGNPDSATLVARFATMTRAEQILIAEYAKAKLLGLERLKRHRILRWSILQHYEVCTTPLLDVTHSIRIAASFASLRRPAPPSSMCSACRTSAARSPPAPRPDCRSCASPASARHRRCGRISRRAICSASIRRCLAPSRRKTIFHMRWISAVGWSQNSRSRRPRSGRTTIFRRRRRARSIRRRRAIRCFGWRLGSRSSWAGEDELRGRDSHAATP